MTSHSVDVVVVETAFHALFGVVALLAFVLIPFTYFFVEDEEGDDDLLGGYSRAGCFDRAVGALRNTAFFVIAIVILVLVALFFKPMSETTKESSDVHVWVKTLLSEWQGGAIERGLLLTVGCMAVLGLLNLVLYTAYGLAALPVYMMRSTQALEDEQIKEDMNEVERQQKRTVIQSKLQDPTTSGKLRDRYVKELERLREQDKAAAKRKERLSAMSNDWMYTIWRVLYPIRCFVGFALAAVTVLIVTTLALSAADMWLNSLCGIRCGFVMDTPSFINPLDSVLVFLSKYFPLDSVALGVVAGYLLIASVYGIVKYVCSSCIHNNHSITLVSYPGSCSFAFPTAFSCSFFSSLNLLLFCLIQFIYPYQPSDWVFALPSGRSSRSDLSALGLKHCCSYVPT